MPYSNIEDQRAACRKHYQNNKQEYLDKVNHHRIYIRKKLQGYKSTIKCVRCPESDPRCIDFHHTNPKKKKFNVSNACVRTTSWVTVLAEIKKCIPLCANCHRKETIAR